MIAAAAEAEADGVAAEADSTFSGAGSPMQLPPGAETSLA